MDVGEGRGGGCCLMQNIYTLILTEFLTILAVHLLIVGMFGVLPSHAPLIDKSSGFFEYKSNPSYVHLTSFMQYVSPGFPIFTTLLLLCISVNV